MAGSRYTRKELFLLRNHIPIDRVIDKMGLPSRMIEGHYRFYCPVCHEFDTGINPKTNLSRCFRCKKNYNTIDLVMTVMGLNFIDSVAYLEPLKPTAQPSVKTLPPPVSAPGCSKTAVKSNVPVAIGDIFRALAKSGPTSSQLRENEIQTIVGLQKRIADLEAHVKSLSEKLALIERR
jgi:hypothetical protein